MSVFRDLVHLRERLQLVEKVIETSFLRYSQPHPSAAMAADTFPVSGKALA